MMFQLSLPWGPGGYVSYGKVAAFHEKLINRLNALPGITSVGVALRIPLANRGTPNLDMQLQPYDGDDRRTVPAVENIASAEYFHSIGIPLRAGRSVRSGDLRGAPAVVVSERLASLLTRRPTASVVAKRLMAEGAPPTTFTIVGVVGDVHWDRIERGYVPMLYFPLLRDADGLPADSNPIQYLPMVLQYAVRGARLPSALAIQAIVSQLDPRVPVSSVRTLDSVVDDATAHVRLTMLLVAVAGAAALLLAMIGVYSVVAYAANGRVREFAIRLALGAEPTRLAGKILGEGLRLVAIGTLAGFLVALGTTRFLRALLYEVKPTSVREFGIAITILVVVTLFATLLPARRAARTHPAAVLHGE